MVLKLFLHALSSNDKLFFFQGKQRMANVLFFQAKTARGQILQFFQGRQTKVKNTEISQSLTNYGK